MEIAFIKPLYNRIKISKGDSTIDSVTDFFRIFFYSHIEDIYIILRQRKKRENPFVRKLISFFIKFSTFFINIKKSF